MMKNNLMSLKLESKMEESEIVNICQHLQCEQESKVKTLRLVVKEKRS